MGKDILFDLDGTLTDSGEGIINCALHALAHFGLPLPTREEMRVFVGPPLTDSFQKFGVPADRVQEAIQVYRSRYMVTGIFENFVYPGITELLETLTAQGHRLFVATSKPEFMTNQILERFGLISYFTLICGASTDTKRNTKEAVIAYLLEQVGELNSPVMIGDTVFDIKGAAFHGIPAVGVGWGYGKEADMIDAGAAAIVQNTEELLDYLEA